MSTTQIEWCRNPDGSYGKTWNPITGCSPVSLGCKNCYGKRIALRLRGRFGYPKDDPFKVTLHPDKLNYPLSLAKPSIIFPCSMGDMFHPDVPFEFIDNILSVIASSKRHTYMILTKRPGRMVKYFKENRYLKIIQASKSIEVLFGDSLDIRKFPDFPWPHIYLGVTVVTQAEADVNIPILLQIPAACHFVSIEPMLETIDLKRVKWWPANEHYVDVLNRGYWHPSIGLVNHSDIHKIDWVIAGGETGAGARPIHPDWIMGLRDHCQQANTPFFFKSWGEWSMVYDRDRDDPDWRKCPKAKDGSERYLNFEGGYGFHGDRVVFMRRKGKKASGRIIDGREWNQFPVNLYH
jgi:protein gp37